MRAYSTDIGSADQGVLMNVAVTRRFKQLPRLSLQAFYDAAHARFNKNPFPGTANTVNRKGSAQGAPIRRASMSPSICRMRDG